MPFVQNTSLVFPTLKQHNLAIGRCYSVESGRDKGLVFPSITRVLGARPKPGLAAWKKRVGAREAARVSERATVQGANIHKLTECFLGNDELPRYGPNVAELWSRLRPWLTEQVSVVYAQEQDVYSTRLKVAGRMDLLVGLSGIDQELAIVDIKTAAREKSADYITDYFLQATFYALSVFELTGIPVKTFRIPITHPTGLQVFEGQVVDFIPELRRRIDEFYLTYDAEANTALAHTSST